MTRFFIKWSSDYSRLPPNPLETAKFRLKMVEMVKAELSAGRFTDWGSFSNAKDGYAIIEGSEEDVQAIMLKWVPNLSYDVFPLLNADQYFETVKRAIAAMQGK
ncbi:MAG: hypothetical protein ABSD89_11540 [Halobacteriota archaeon]|jgi:hypothetical protein